MSKASKAAKVLGSLGGKARAENLSDVELANIARKGGKERAKRHTKAELRQFARNAGRRPALNQAQINQLRQWRADGVPVTEIARRFKVTPRTISRYSRSATPKPSQG